jgi:hypothetical protein
MKGSYNRWWLLPLGILNVSAMIAVSIMIFGPSFVGPSIADCSGDRANDYACYQQRYQDLVNGPGVKAAFADLKSEYPKNDFVRMNCHQLAHVIGRSAADIYGYITSTYSQGDSFCSAGYYHGVMETVMARIGPDRIVDEANTLCAELSEQQQYSYYHRNCVHGLGHGFMAVLKGDLYGSLRACDTLTDDWERQHCYSGTFMENVISKDNPDHPSKYLKADQPLYPCTEVDTKYKDQCYKRQSLYILGTQNSDFAKVFGVCGTVESDFRPSCYQGMGWDIGALSINGESFTHVDKSKLPSQLCMLGKDYEARSNCVAGAAKLFVQFYYDDTQLKEMCDSFSSKLRAACLKSGKEYYETFEA